MYIRSTCMICMCTSTCIRIVRVHTWNNTTYSILLYAQYHTPYKHTLSHISPPALRFAFALTFSSLSREWKCSLSPKLLACTIISPFRLRLLPPSTPTGDISPLSLTPFPQQIQALRAFLDRFKRIETKEIFSMLKKSIIIPPYTILYVPISIQWYLSTCISEHHNPLVNKKKFSNAISYMYYIYHYQLPALGRAHEDLDTIKNSQENLERMEKKKKPPSSLSPYLLPPTLIRNFEWWVGIGQCFVGRRSGRDSFFYPAKGHGTPYCWAEELIEWPTEPAPIRGLVFSSPDLSEWLPLTNIKSRLQPSPSSSWPYHRMPLDWKLNPFYYYFIYIVATSSLSYLSILCLVFCQFCNIPVHTGWKKIKKKPRSPPKTPLFFIKKYILYLYIPIYITA